MQFTKAEAYGVLGILYLAEQDNARTVPLSEIAQGQDIPEKFLAKIFQGLTKTGIVRSYRGIKGGFALTRNPDSITMKDVVEAIQGPYHLIKCLDDADSCGKYESCPIRPVLEEAELKLLEVFDNYTIADILKLNAGKKPN